MAFRLFNRANMTVSGTPGTGDVTLGSAATASQSLASAGANDGDTFPYVLEDGTAWEIGMATYHSTGPTVSRTKITASSNSGSAISATSSAIIYCGVKGEDVTGPMRVPLVADLSAVTNLYSATLTDRVTDGLRSLHIKPSTTHSSGALGCALMAAPSGNFSVVCKVKGTFYGNAAGYTGAGPVLHNSGNGNCSYIWQTLDASVSFYGAEYTGGFTSGSPVLGNNMYSGDHFLHFDYDGTNILSGLSQNGIDVIWARSVTLASFLGAVTHVGVGWSVPTVAGIGPEFDVLHFNAGARGSGGFRA